MRYFSKGEVHLDFHGATNTTIQYIVENYGAEALREILRHTALDVYRSIAAKVKAGDLSEWILHWVHHMNREGGDFELSVTPDETRLEILSCPAIRHLKRLGLRIAPQFCQTTCAMNEAFAEDSPFSATTEVLSEGHCVQTFVRRREVSP